MHIKVYTVFCGRNASLTLIFAIPAFNVCSAIKHDNMLPSFSENIHLYSLHIIKQTQGLSWLAEPQKEIKFDLKT